MRKPTLSPDAEQLQTRLNVINDEVRALEVAHEFRSANADDYITQEERQKLVVLKADAARLAKAFETALSLSAVTP